MAEDLPTEGVTPHIRRMRDIVKQFGVELEEMHKLEAALKAAVDRLERGANLVHMESRMVEQLIKREKAKLIPVTSTTDIVNKVQADLELLMVEKPVGIDGNGNPVSISVPVAKR